ncbi:MAG TPA: TIGR01841 family phasin [Geminicoccaceae bacterium]
MAKVNVNTATREQFVDVAGLKPQVADAILKLRTEHGGKIAGLDALKDLPRTAGATMDQLRDTLEFGVQVAQDVTKKAGETAQKGAEIASFAAKSGADVASFAAKSGADAAKLTADRTAEAGQQVARAGADMAHRAMAAVGDAEKQAARRSTEAATDVSQLFVSLVKEQMEHNVEVMKSLARVRNWREALDVQNAYLRASIERMTNGTTRYVEVVTKLATGMASLTRDEVKKAA